MAMAGIPEGKEDNVNTFVSAILPYMTQEDTDAVGYAALKDRLYGERWLNVKHAFKFRPITKQFTKINERIETSPQYNRFGDRFGVNNLKAMILHSRYATCEGGINNAHPFVSQDGKTALIHNGRVGVKGLKLINSTCDSEGILNEYVDKDVSNNPSNIQHIFNKVKGAFACAVLTEDNYGRKFMDLFRNDQYPALYTCFIPALNNMVFCTRPDILENAIRELGWTMEEVHTIKDNSFIRLDANTGEYVFATEVKKQKKKGKKNG